MKKRICSLFLFTSCLFLFYPVSMVDQVAVTPKTEISDEHIDAKAENVDSEILDAFFKAVAELNLPEGADETLKQEKANVLKEKVGTSDFTLHDVSRTAQKELAPPANFAMGMSFSPLKSIRQLIEEAIDSFVNHFASKDMPSILQYGVKVFPYLNDYIMVGMMKEGLKVQSQNYTTDPNFNGNNSDKKDFPTDWYIRTLLPRSGDVTYKQNPDEIVENIFSRPEGAKPEPEPNNKSCLLFPWFAQWFVEEFFKTGKTFHPDIEQKDKECSEQWGGNQIDLTTIYGSADHPERTRALRLLKDGKMKTKTIDGEAYPPYWIELTKDEQKACPMFFPDNVSDEKKDKFFALGHPRHNLHPGLMVMYTIFLREHNRVCDGLLKQESTKNCTDDQLFEIARKVLIGILLKLVVNAYIQHINPAKSFFLFQYKPELLKKIPDWSSNPQTHRIAQEFDLLYRWHPLIPDTVDDIDGTSTPVPDTFWDTNYLTSRGIDAVVRSAIRQPANAFGYKKSPRFLASLDASGVRQAREKMKLQSFTAYAKRFGSSGPKSFEDFNPEAVDALKAAYESVDDIEFFVGIINEKVTKGIFPSTLTTLVLAHAMNGIFANELSIHGKWTESTFGGGKFAFDVANNVTLPDLIARNTNLEQKEVSFNVIA